MIAQPQIQRHLLVDLVIVLNEQIVVCVAHPGARLAPGANRPGSVAGEIVQRIVADIHLEDPRFVVLVANDLRADFQLVPAVNPRQRIEPGERVVGNQQTKSARPHPG